MERLQIGPADLFANGFWILVFGAFQLERLYECAVWMFLFHLCVSFMQLLHRGVKAGLCDAASDALDDAASDAARKASDSENASASEDENEDENESDASSEKSQSDNADGDHALAFFDSADKVLVAADDEVDNAKAHLFYHMFANGVVEFLHDGHLFTLSRDVHVVKQ